MSRGWLSVSWSLQRPLAGLWPTCEHDNHTPEHASTTSALTTSSYCISYGLQGSEELPSWVLGEPHMMVPAVPPHTMELAASPRIARAPSPEGAAEGGLPGTTRRSPCTSHISLTTACSSLIHQQLLQALTAWGLSCALCNLFLQPYTSYPCSGCGRCSIKLMHR